MRRRPDEESLTGGVTNGGVVRVGDTVRRPPRLRRTHEALDAYGTAFDVPAILAREYDRAEERCRRSGWDRQLAKLPLGRAWLDANRGLF